MAYASLNSPAQRIGKQLGRILKHAILTQTLEISGEAHTAAAKRGATVSFRQVVPFGATASAPNTFSNTAAAHLIQEGVTPPADSMVVLDTEVTVNKYGALYCYTDHQEKLGEDDIPSWMEEQLGERLGDVREKIYIGAVQGCTNRFYSGGTTRLTTDEPVTQNLVNRITRNLASNHAKFTRNAASSSVNYGSVSLQKTYLAFGNTVLQQDIEAIPGYKAVSDYGKMMQTAHEMEIGSVGSVRFILSPDMPLIADAGAAIAGTSNYSTTGTSADIAQLFVIAKDAWGHVAFRGLEALKITHLKPSDIDKSDMTGERGYVSGTFYDCALITNHGWMCVAEVTYSALT